MRTLSKAEIMATAGGEQYRLTLEVKETLDDIHLFTGAISGGSIGYALGSLLASSLGYGYKGSVLLKTAGLLLGADFAQFIRRPFYNVNYFYTNKLSS